MKVGLAGSRRMKANISFEYSEMFLGKAHKDFHFEPKHKSNAYDTQAEG
jgi:hypothetical protein